MTPDEWENCDDSMEMVSAIRATPDPRKLRLFACSCCRRITHLLEDERGRRAVEVAEAFADGRASEKVLQRAHAAAEAAEAAADGTGASGAAGAAIAWATTPWAPQTPSAAKWATWAAGRALGPDEAAGAAARAAERAIQAGFLRCIFGNPFRPRPAPVLAPAVLAWNAGAAGRLAEAIYRACRFEDLPVLADLLEEAGCCEADLLDHLRGPGPHVRGCWALDAALGKS
jgi:hypothetical protein